MEAYCLISYREGLGTSLLATIYLHSLKEHSEIHKIPKCGVHKPNNEHDTTI